jgi:hypothetical protein
MNRYNIIIVILITVLVISSCGRRGRQKEPEFNAEVKKIGSVSYITNPSFSKMLPKEYKLEEKMAIGNDIDENYIFIRPIKLDIDDIGNIYVFENRKCEVRIFDKKGKFLKKIGKKGQGPSEILSASDMVVDEKNNIIHILDRENLKILRFNQDGKLESEFKVKVDSPEQLFVDQQGYYLINNYFYDDNKYQKYKFYKYNFSGKILKNSKDFIASNKKLFVKGNFIRTGATPFDPWVCFASNKKGKLFYGFPDKYEIIVFDFNFNKIKVIRKRNPERTKVADEEKEKFINYLREREKKKGKPYFIDSFQFPEYHPLFTSIWLDDKGRILLEIPSKDNKAHIDVFNSEGIYVEEMIINAPPDGTSLKHIFRNPVFKDGCIYTLVRNKDDLIQIKKYRLIEKT